MKKKTIVFVSVVLALTMVITATAAIYISQQAKMTLFSGRIEQSTSQPNDPKMVLRVSGENVGQDGNVSVYNEAVFPILTKVEGNSVALDPAVWTDENGRQPISAPGFVLSAENGEVNNVYYKIVVNGNTSVAEALRFGISIRYYSEEIANEAPSGEVMSSLIDSINPGKTSTEPMLLGDGNILEGEDVEIYISAWVDSYTLAEIGEYDDEGFTIDIVFFTQETE